MKTKHNFDMTHGTQEVFRLLLDALANPGKIVSINEQVNTFSANGKWLAPALTLLDNECGFFWDGDNDTKEEIRFLSGSSFVSLNEADFVFIKNQDNANEVLSVIKSGTHRDPHKSALIFISIKGSPDQKLMIKGPGIPPEGREIFITQTEKQWLRTRDDQKFEYPCGTEIIFLREDNSLMAITRKAEIKWLM